MTINLLEQRYSSLRPGDCYVLNSAFVLMLEAPKHAGAKKSGRLSWLALVTFNGKTKVSERYVMGDDLISPGLFVKRLTRNC